MTVLVDSKIFNQMISYKPYTESQSQSKKMKFTLLDDIKDYFSDKWNRLKNGTRSAIDMMTFLSCERGFVYASQLYLGERYGVSDRTIRRVASELEQAGLIYIVYRRHSKGNSKGKPIYLFTEHPYFKHWIELLGIDVQKRVQEETSETTDIPMPKGAKKVSTYTYQLKQESNYIYSNLSDNKIIQYVVNRIQDSIKQGTKIKYLSSYIDKIVHSLEKQSLYAENERLKQLQKQRAAESARLAEELGIKKQQQFPFYNWLEDSHSSYERNLFYKKTVAKEDPFSIPDDLEDFLLDDVDVF